MPPQLFAAEIAHLTARLAGGQRLLLGLVGPPGAGKSTLADGILQAFPTRAQVVPMDGYHLAQAELERLGRAARKGAQDTFDSAGYAALLRRLRERRDGETVYAPAFRREIEEPIAGAIAVEPETQLVITEGNYLLLAQGHWAQVRSLLDEVWYVEVDATLRRERLLARHMQFGRSREQSVAWMAQTDDPNARQIELTKGLADRVVKID